MSAGPDLEISRAWLVDPSVGREGAGEIVVRDGILRRSPGCKAPTPMASGPDAVGSGHVEREALAPSRIWPSRRLIVELQRGKPGASVRRVQMVAAPASIAISTRHAREKRLWLRVISGWLIAREVPHWRGRERSSVTRRCPCVRQGWATRHAEV